MNFSKKMLLPAAPLLLFLFSGHSVADDACAKAFMNSSAARTCTGNEVTTQDPVGTCNLNQTCLGEGTHPTGHGIRDGVAPDRASNEISVPLSDVIKLLNCDGTLKVGSC